MRYPQCRYCNLYNMGSTNNKSCYQCSSLRESESKKNVRLSDIFFESHYTKSQRKFIRDNLPMGW